MNDMSNLPAPHPLKAAALPSTATPCLSIPADFPMPNMEQGGKLPAATYEYRNADNTLACLIARYEHSDGGKRFCPSTVWTFDGQMHWVSKGLPDQTPPYRLTELIAHPQKPVLISEGEKCADTAAVFDGFVSITWRGGSNALKKTDFSALKGRDVIILPDDDEPGAKAATQLCDILKPLGVSRLRVFRTAALATMLEHANGKGFDIADAITAGLNEARFVGLLDREDMVEEINLSPARDAEFHEKSIYDELHEKFGAVPELPDHFELTKDGIFKHEIDGNGRPDLLFAGSPIVVLGRTKLADGRGGWGYHLAVRTPQSEWERQTVPARLLASNGRELLELIADLGGVVPQKLNERRALGEYIAYAQNCPIINVANRPGWCSDAFALPDEIIKPADMKTTLTLDMGDRPHYLATAGTMESWQRLTSMAAPNSRATFALCAALAAPLLRPLGIEGGGFHLYGQSSRGKTTLLTLAGSVWGGGGRDGFVRSWRMTNNGGEGMIADHNDLLLCLDEMTLVGPELIAELLYMLANGHGKARAKKDGSAAKSAQWNSLVLSSGENTITHQIEQGRGKNRLTGGMAVRMIDVPIEVEPGVSFEDHGEFETGAAFSDEIKTLAKSNYGHAGRAFLRAIVKDRKAILEKAQEQVDWFISRLIAPEDDPQVQRVARRFAVLGSAGLLAAKHNILLISPEQIVTAVTSCFKAWKDARGGGYSEEWRGAARHLRYFFEAHGATRFERLVRGKAEEDDAARSEDHAIRDRCGYRIEQEDGTLLYYVFPSAWESDLCGPHSPDLMVKIARESGALAYRDEGRNKKKVRLPDYPTGTRVYAIRPDLLPEV
jgi:uncharacterized protein (DUF927 family)